MADEAYRAVFLRVHPTGKMVLSLTTDSDGKESQYAQLVADELGVPALDVKVVAADTDRFGVGHGYNTAPSAGTAATLFTPYFAPDEPDRGGTYGNSYLNDGQSRGASWQVRQGGVAKYSGSPDTSSGMGPNWGCTLQTMQRLTTSFSALKTAVNAMTANGDTNIPMGLMWGWHTLSPNAPLADGVAYLTPKHKKIVILMTDGQNQMTDSGNSDQSYYSGAGYAWQGRVLQASGTPINGNSTQTERSAALDDRLSKVCTAMKAADKDIEIYTMRVEVVGGTSTVLQDCASGADHYFDVTDSAQLDAVFQQIAGAIAALHLSK